MKALLMQGRKQDNLRFKKDNKAMKDSYSMDYTTEREN